MFELFLLATIKISLDSLLIRQIVIFSETAIFKNLHLLGRFKCNITSFKENGEAYQIQFVFGFVLASF